MSKKNYYHHIIEKCTNNTKSTWNSVNDFFEVSGLPSKLNVNEKSIVVPKSICDNLINFFSSIGEKCQILSINRL